MSFALSNGSTTTRRDHDFDIGVRRKDLRARDDTGGVLLVDDSHQVMTSDGPLIAYECPCLPI